MSDCDLCKHPLIEHGDYPEEKCDCCSGREFNKQATPKPRTFKKFFDIPSAPGYVINRQGTIKHVRTGHFPLYLRLTKDGRAIINLRIDGKNVPKTVQELLDEVFGVVN